MSSFPAGCVLVELNIHLHFSIPAGKQLTHEHSKQTSRSSVVPHDPWASDAIAPSFGSLVSERCLSEGTRGQGSRGVKGWRTSEYGEDINRIRDKSVDRGHHKSCSMEIWVRFRRQRQSFSET